MKAIIWAVLFLMGISFNSLLLAEELSFPLPADAVKIKEKSMDVGPTRSFTQTYETSFSQDRISSFYKKEMLRAGWREQKSNFFLKDRDLVILVTIPNRGKGRKTRFSIITSRMPTKEEMLAGRKDNPDKLDFMPTYPGCAQVFLWNTATGISASYETAKDIKDVFFFYKSAMLNYGWTLYSETPIETKQVDCPECRKKMESNIPRGGAIPDMQGTSSKASLIFRREGAESCTIRLYQTSLNMQSEIPSSDKTNILVTYSENKKNTF